MALSTQTFAFLRDLKQHNNREWFQEHKDRYEEALADVKAFVADFIARLSDIDPTIPASLPVSKCLFRIYRDVRFSNNKLPYKAWFSIGISAEGRKFLGPAYYLHVEADKCYLAVGYWRPDKDHLALIRQEIDYNVRDLHAALAAGAWDAQMLSQEDLLKRPPLGYSADHPELHLLKLKSFILYLPLTEEALSSHEAMPLLLDAAQRMEPFKRFLQQAID